MINELTMLKFKSEEFARAKKILTRAGVETMWDRVLPYYEHGSEVRAYHNLNHALNVVRNVVNMKTHPSAMLVLAALWHDAIYVPGAKASANEDASAAVFHAELYSALANSPVQGFIRTWLHTETLIQKTSIRCHMTKEFVDMGEDLDILLDADLSGLGGPWNDFLRDQLNIIREHKPGQEPTGEDLHACAVFLLKLRASKEGFYRTPIAKLMWEARAKENLARLFTAAKEWPVD